MTQSPTHPNDAARDAGTDRLTIEAMAGFQGPAPAFLQELLATVCTTTGGTHAAVVRGPEDNQAGGILACFPPSVEQHRDQGDWLRRIQSLLETAMPDRTTRMPLQKQTGQPAWAQIILTPLRDPDTGNVRAALCVLLETDDAIKTGPAAGHLEHAAQVLARYELAQALHKRDHAMDAMARAMQCVEVINREPRFRPAGIALCNEVADRWRASRVSVGFLAGQTVKLRAMSHTEDISRKMLLVQDIEAAMEECVDQDSEVLTPQPDSATTINRQAKRFADKHGPACVCILPLRLHEDVVGAIAVEWPSDHTIDPEEVEALRLAANLFAARLHQFHLDDRWLGARMATSIRHGAAVAVGPKHTWAKLLTLAAFGFLAFAFLVKGDDTVDAPFTVETTQRQIISAPFEGTLLSVGEGIEINEQVVGRDQPDRDATVLARLDTSELRVERASVEAQIADFNAQADAARGENDLAGVEVALANVRRLQAQRDLYDYRIQRSTLTSPVSGIILEGDLKQRVNGVLEKGEALFELAPLDALRGEMRVPASRVGDVRSRLTHPDNPSQGELASVSHPGEFIRFTVERIEPVAEVVEGENVFRVRITFEDQADWLQPGVEGKARVFVARRPYFNLWTREAVNWVRMKLWL